MYNCPNKKDYQNYYGDIDEKEKRWLFHLNNCTCPIMDLYEFKMVKQDDHVRAYWEAEGRLEVTWHLTYGMSLHYPKCTIDLSIRYPY